MAPEKPPAWFPLTLLIAYQEGGQGRWHNSSVAAWERSVLDMYGFECYNNMDGGPWAMSSAHLKHLGGQHFRCEGWEGPDSKPLLSDLFPRKSSLEDVISPLQSIRLIPVSECQGESPPQHQVPSDWQLLSQAALKQWNKHPLLMISWCLLFAEETQLPPMVHFRLNANLKRKRQIKKPDMTAAWRFVWGIVECKSNKRLNKSKLGQTDRMRICHQPAPDMRQINST